MTLIPENRLISETGTMITRFIGYLISREISAGCPDRTRTSHATSSAGGFYQREPRAKTLNGSVPFGAQVIIGLNHGVTELVQSQPNQVLFVVNPDIRQVDDRPTERNSDLCDSLRVPTVLNELVNLVAAASQSLWGSDLRKAATRTPGS
jgi:hypothetical protein